MKSGKKVAACSALLMACAPVTASAAELFSERFDTGTNATIGARFDTFGVDAANGGDFAADFHFDYGAFTYAYALDPDEFNTTTATIPLAPRSTGPDKFGLRLDVNNNSSAPSPNMAVINAYPKLAQYAGGQLPSGDHKMTVDVWMNYNGGAQLIGGGTGSTEHMSIGINQTGGGIGGAIPQNLSTLVTVGGPYPNQPGLGWSMTGEEGNTCDVRFWRSNARFGPDFEDLNAEVGYVAQDQGNAAPGPGNGTNPYYQDAFPFYNPANGTEVWYETTGGIGKHWTTIEMKYEDGIVYHYAKPAGFNPALAPASIAPYINADGFILMGARTDDSAVQGLDMLGYLDSNNGTAGTESRTGNNDACFIVFDNMVVESVTQVRQKWGGPFTANWSNSGAWQGGDVADGVSEVADFTVALGTSQVVTVDSPKTVRSVTFDSGNASTGYLINGGSTLTLDSLTDAIRTTVKATSGTHEISAPVVSKKPMIFNVSAGASVKIDNLSFNIVLNPALVPIPDNIVKNGAGVAEINRFLFGSATNVKVNAGVLRLTPDSSANGVSTAKDLTIGATGKLDLSANKLILKSAIGTLGTGNTYTGVSGMVQAGRGTGSWNGANGIITSQTHATVAGLTSIGVATAAQVKGVASTATATWAGQTVTGSDTLVMYTYGGVANLDGKINIDDYGHIDTSVGLIDQGWFNGDFNYDGKINIDDYGIIDVNVGVQTLGTFPTGAGVAGSSLTAVPEPASIGALGLAVIAWAGRRRRRDVDEVVTRSAGGG